MATETNAKTILDRYGPIGVDVLKNALNSVRATGKTQASISFKVTSTNDYDKLTFFAREFMELIEKGRRPTTKKPSPEMIENLAEYARARGITSLKGKPAKPEQVAWAIATVINREGDKTYRMGGRVVYSELLDKFIDELKEVLKKDFVLSFRNNLKSALRGTVDS